MRYLCEPDADLLAGCGLEVTAHRALRELPATPAWWSLLSPCEQPRARELADPGAAIWQAVAVVDDSVVSQFDVLVEAARNGIALPDALACLALTGSGFHGNRQRPWRAARGNLHLSSFCRLPLDAALCGPALSMLPTLAVTDLLSPLVGDRAWIKWVNDVYLDDAKVSGSLVSTAVDGELIESFVLGIGLNVEASPRLPGHGFVPRVTCLRDAGVPLSPLAAAEGLLAALATRIAQLRDAGPAALFDDYVRRSRIIGRQVSIYPDDASSPQGTLPMAAGRLRAIHPDLSLEIEGHSGRYRTGRLQLSPQESR